MLILRNFTESDVLALQRTMHPDMPTEQIKELIAAWNRKEVNNRYFEMFAILKEETVVGKVSLYQHSKEVISIGPEVFAAFRRKGYAKEAMSLACSIARGKGYKIVSQQIRCDNEASIALHNSLGFETNGLVYTSAKGSKVSIYLKSLL
ncbi:MAG: GNAT family N-acetyltransferase [Ruminococcaceae bacterium]|nr:GNAT family N-acetyltransferase [Oscillospiraceae bacterium]